VRSSILNRKEECTVTFKRWATPVLLTAFALVACAEQGANETETMQSDTAMEATGAMEAPGPDPASTDIATWNTDADARLTAEEFSGWLAEQDFYAAWNTDGAEGLTAQEFGSGLAGVLDVNGDGSVSGMEWGDAGAGWVGADAALADWDGDGDGALSADEVVAGVEGSDLWTQWDQDGSGALDRSEFDAAVFAAWDSNGDGFVDEMEWGANFDFWS
jgi:hypothetical protein